MVARFSATPPGLFSAGIMDETPGMAIGLDVRVLRGLRAQHAACHVGTRETGRLAQRGDADRMHGYRAALPNDAERVARDEIATRPGGTCRLTDHSDSDRLSDDAVPLAVAITAVGDGTPKVSGDGSSRRLRATCGMAR
ncbi:hydantoinase B/oxoprolinase family protein [Roseomonas sp. HF4]|uniref:hydantoinase B/oxoprolinase family protein n=1 Tax=Roseomonas sp. HF4 TaxID=2562313 RepID=UPI001484E801|nr:hydantoinase B/oxoprolinase family protein [Roseomonas sp. HF4]